MQTGNNYLVPTITEHRIVSRENKKLARATIATATFLFAISAIIFKFSPLNTIILGTILFVFETILVLFLTKPTIVQRADYTHIVEKPVVQTIEKPVYYTIKQPVSRKEKQKLIIPKYNFVGSSETQRFHERNCRLGKLIKRKYKISDDSKSFFRNRDFVPCKACLN